jgi:hypothetical protein
VARACMHVRPISIPRSTSPHAAAPAQQLRRTIACTLKFFVLPLSKYPLLPFSLSGPAGRIWSFSFLTDQVYSYNIQWFFRRMEGRALVDLRSDTVRLCVTPCALAWARRSPLLSAPAQAEGQRAAYSERRSGEAIPALRVFYKGLQGVRAHTQFRGFAAAPKHTHTPRRWRALACR